MTSIRHDVFMKPDFTYPDLSEDEETCDGECDPRSCEMCFSEAERLADRMEDVMKGGPENGY